MNNENIISEVDTKMLRLFKILHRVKMVTIKDNFKDIMTEKYPNEYSEKDDTFFNTYRGKYTYVYKYRNCNDDKDWFILEDNNYPITEDCWL